MAEQNKPYMAKIDVQVSYTDWYMFWSLLLNFCIYIYRSFMIIQIECHFRNKMDNKYLTITWKKYQN